MVSCYGYEIWRHKYSQANFGWKYMCFKIGSTINVNLVAKVMQNAYLCVIIHVKHKKIPFLAVLTWFLILGKIQDGCQDGDHCWWRHIPPAAQPPMNIPHLVKKIRGFPLKVKLFQNIATYPKLRGGAPSTPPPPHPLYHGGGMNLRVRPRVNYCGNKRRKMPSYDLQEDGTSRPRSFVSIIVLTFFFSCVHLFYFLLS